MRAEYLRDRTFQRSVRLFILPRSLPMAQGQLFQQPPLAGKRRFVVARVLANAGGEEG